MQAEILYRRRCYEILFILSKFSGCVTNRHPAEHAARLGLTPEATRRTTARMEAGGLLLRNVERWKTLGDWVKTVKWYGGRDGECCITN